MALIDTHVYWGEWPFSNTAFWDARRLHERLRRLGVTRAFVSPFGHALCKDEYELDRQFIADARGDALFSMVAGLNLKEAYWPKRLGGMIADHVFSGVILHPATRHFMLDDAALIMEFFHRLHGAGLPVFVSVGIEEERMRPLALNARGIKLDEIIRFIDLAPASAPVIMLGLPGDDILKVLAGSVAAEKTVLFDTANMDSGAQSRWQRLDARFCCFGSFCPMLAPEAALRTLEFSFDAGTRAMIYGGNITRALACRPGQSQKFAKNDVSCKEQQLPKI